MPESTVKEKKGFHYSFLIVACGIVLTCVPCALVLSCAGIYFEPVSSYFGVPKAAFTMYFSILNLMMMVTLPVAGKMMSKLDLRVMLSACVLLCGGACIAMSRFTAIWQFYITGVTLGIGVAPLIYLAIPTLINAWCAKKVGFFVGLCMAFTGVGGVIFNPIGTALIQTGPEGWRTGYLVFGILILVLALPFTVFVVRSKPEDKGLKPYGYDESAKTETVVSEQAAAGIPAGKAMKMPAFFMLAAFCGIITINQTVYQFLPSYAQSFALSAPQIALLSGAIASACSAGQALGKVLLGIINDKSVYGGLLFGIGGGTIGVLLLIFLPTYSVCFLIGGFLFGVVYACTTVQTPLMTRTVFGSADYTNIYSRISMVGALASAFAAVFWGVIADLENGFTWMLILSIVCMMLAFILGYAALKSVRSSQGSK